MAALSLKASHMNPFDRTTFRRANLKASLSLVLLLAPSAASALSSAPEATPLRARFDELGMLCDEEKPRQHAWEGGVLKG